MGRGGQKEIGVSCLSTVQFLSSRLLGSNLGVRNEAANAAERMSVHVVALIFARNFESTRERERESQKETDRALESSQLVFSYFLLHIRGEAKSCSLSVVAHAQCRIVSFLRV